MAKNVVTRDRFRIICEADAEHMGALLAQMTRMGLENIGYELITDVRSFRSNKVHDQTPEEQITAWLPDHPTFKAAELVRHLKELGRPSPSTTYTTLDRMVAAGKLKKLGPGNYSVPGVKALAAPKAEKSAEGRQQHDVTNKDLIWKAIKNRKGFKVADIRELFEKEGRNEKSISPQLMNLIAEKKVKRLVNGEYEVLKPKAPAKAKAPKKKSAMNGAGAEAAHGTA